MGVGPAVGSDIAQMMQRDPGKPYWRSCGKFGSKSNFGTGYDRTFGKRDLFKNLSNKEKEKE